MINLRLTPEQAKIIWNVIDGASDAGSCKGGCTKQELELMDQISKKLLKYHDKWKDVVLEPG